MSHAQAAAGELTTSTSVQVDPESGATETPAGERKTVTALFANTKGSMELLENLDLEEAQGIVDPALKLMIDAVHRYAGYIVLNVAWLSHLISLQLQ